MGQTLNQLQLLGFGFLGAMTLFGLYLHNRGDPIPQALTLGMFAGVAFLLYSAFNAINTPSPEVANSDPQFFDREGVRKAERKARKAQKKAEAEAAAYDVAVAQAAHKLAAKRVAQAEAKARKVAEKAAAEKAKQAAEKANAPETSGEGGGGKKKKKKKKKDFKPAAATAVVAAAAEEEPAPQEDEFETVVNKLTVRNQKKAALRKEMGITEADHTVPEVTEYMNVDHKHYGVLRGQGAKNIIQLQNLFDCKIQLPNKNDSSDVVVITGNAAQIPGVQEAIKQLCDKGYCKALSGDMSDVQMTVSNARLLIGPGGSNISAIQSKTGVKINLPKKEDREDGKDIVVTLLGDLSSIQNAMTAITELMTNGFSQLTHPDWTSTQIGFPGSMLGILLGPKGANIRAIEKETETTIKVPNAKTEEDKARLLMITITGAEENVNKARSRISAVQTDFVRKELDFPANLLASLIGNKGENVQRLQKTCNVRINIAEHLWDPTMRAVTVEGFNKDANAALAEIAQIISTHSRAEVEFPASRIGVLIGRKGETVNKIKDSTSTRITVTSHDWDETVKIIQIDGLTENVRNAVTQIEVLKAPPPKKEKKAAAEASGDDAASPKAEGEDKKERRKRKPKAAETDASPEAAPPATIAKA